MFKCQVADCEDGSILKQQGMLHMFRCLSFVQSESGLSSVSVMTTQSGSAATAAN